MTTAILQSLAAGLAAFAIFVGWRRISAASRPIFRVVTAGVLLRAIGGQLAFWISYLSLPVGRSLQIGRGLWVFALDAMGYTGRAAAAAHAGPVAIVLMDRTETSVFFAQVLATAMFLFGAVASVAIIINLAAYLGCCAMALSFGRSPNDRTVIVALAALSLTPSAIMWSLQPLKDVCFLFLVAAFFAAARAYQELWTRSDSRRRAAHAALWTAVLFALVYAISGIRFYFGMVIVVVAVVFLLLVIKRADARLPAAAHGAVLFVLLGIAFYTGAGPYVPKPVRLAVEGKASSAAIPRALLTMIADSRAGFDRVRAATMLGAGDLFRDEPVEGGRSSGTVILPSSPVTRLLVGTAAVVLPRLLAQRLGVLDVRGGRGLWLIVEIDTIVFDTVLLFAIVSIARGIRRGALPSPLFWMMILITAVIGGALAYTVSNFGTLFRHRDMLLLDLVFLPLALSASAETYRVSAAVHVR